MFCANCGKQMCDKDNFCSHCGAKIQRVNYPSNAPVNESSKNFSLFVEDTFYLQKRGMVVTGFVRNEPIFLNDIVMILDEDGNILKRGVLISGIEYCKQLIEQGSPDMAVGLLLKDVDDSSIHTGCFLVKGL